MAGGAGAYGTRQRCQVTGHLLCVLIRPADYGPGWTIMKALKAKHVIDKVEAAEYPLVNGNYAQAPPDWRWPSTGTPSA